MTSDAEAPLIFVYLGQPLPDYALKNLELVSKSEARPIYLIADIAPKDLPHGIILKKLDSAWYDFSEFETFRAASSVDKLFRGGFWLHAIERLFVLRAFTRSASLNKFFHAELDILFLGLAGVSEALDSRGRGIFLPPESRFRALASIMYVNDLRTMDKLIAYISSHPHLGNEMKILGHFLARFPNEAFALPSDRVFDPDWPFGLNSIPPSIGLFDTSGFGQWLFGPDRRNTIASARTRYQSQGLNFDFSKVRFSPSRSSDTLLVSHIDDEGPKFRVRSIHVHSKIFQLLRFPLIRRSIIHLSSSGVSLPVSLSTRVFFVRLSRILYSQRSLDFIEGLYRPFRLIFLQLIIFSVNQAGVVAPSRAKKSINKLFHLRKMDSWPFEIVYWPSIPSQEPLLSPSSSEFLMQQTVAIRSEANLFFYALRANQGFLIRRNKGQSTCSTAPRHTFSRIPIFLGDEKGYDDTRHALSYWHEHSLKRQWSYCRDSQLVLPEWVREMFPNGDEDIVAWIRTAVEGGNQSISALRSYATWAFSMKRTKLAYCGTQ